MAQITFIGTGEAFDPDLPNTSILYEGDYNLLLDCGYSVPHAFWRICQDPSFLDGIYLSHIHADHSFGLPALLLWMRLAGREKPLKVFGGPGVETWLTGILNLGYPGSYAPEKCYAIEPTTVAPDAPYSWGNLRIKNAASTHSVRNLAVRLESGSGVVCYSGDGSANEDTQQLFRNSDILVHECYSDTPEVANHAAAADLIPMANEIGVKTLCLLHLGVAFKEPIQRRVSQWQGAMELILPSPGQTLPI